MPSKEHVLLTRAAEQFPDLTDAEKKFLHAVIAGEVADYRSPNDAENDPQHADTWDASRTIRAKVLRVPFTLRRCAVETGVTLAYADTRTLSFSESILNGSGGIALNADGAQVRGDAFLNGGFRAEGTVRLLGASIGGDLTCTGGTFHRPEGDALSADRVQVGGSAFLDDGFRAEGTVRLVNGRVGWLLDDEASWPAPGHLRLDGFVYTAIAAGPIDATARLAWLARQPSTPFRPQPYLQLASVLREHGHAADAKRVLIAKERARRTHEDLGWVARRWNWLLEVTIGYGYRPWLALIWAGFWVMVGGMLFGRGYDKEIVIPTKAEAYDSDKKTPQTPAFYPAFNRWLYAFDTFVPIINFGQKDYWGPQVACKKPGLIGGGGIRLCVLEIRALYLYRWFHIVVGWVLITLVVTGFTNLVRRE